MFLQFAKLVKRCINPTGLDIIRLHNNPQVTLLGLRHLNIATVIDIGANVGQFAKKAELIYPHATFFCFEPVPPSFEKLNAWASKEAKVKVNTFNVALGDQEGTIDMCFHDEFSPSSSILDTTQTAESLYPVMKSQKRISVTLTTLDRALGLADLKHDVLVKMDVQGFEDRVIRGAGNVLKQTKAVIVEISLDTLYESQATFKDIFNLLDAQGFRYAGNLDQKYASDGHVIFLDAVFLR